MPELEENAPALTQAMFMHDCEQAILVFPVDLQTLGEHLPPGYDPLPAEELLEALGVPASGIPTGMGTFLVEAHGCAAEEDGEVLIDVNEQIAIRPGDRDAGLRQAVPFLLYTLERGGASPFVAFRAAHGLAAAADAATMTYADLGDVRTATAEATLDGEPVISFDIPAVPEAARQEFPDGWARLWAVAPGGVLRTEWDGGYGRGAVIYAGGPQPTCSFAPDTMAAAILGVTSCTAWAIDGKVIVPSVAEIHEMDTTWTFTPKAP